MISITQQRKSIRQQRRKLNPFQLRQAEQHIFAQILKFSPLRSAQHIALYLDAFGEVPTRKLILHLLKCKKSVYLPKICPMNQQLYWQKINMQDYRQSRFYRHRLGMLEKMQSRSHTGKRLDIIMMPLVVFDQYGQRIGMGGGFYDRTLHYLKYRPYRVGLAHDFQYTATPLKQQIWDQRLDRVITPKKMYQFKAHYIQAYPSLNPLIV